MKTDGFTLLELLVGVVLAGMAVSLVAAIYATMTSSLTRISNSTRAHEERALARAWLSQALTGVARLDASFEGTPRSMRVRSSLWVPEGWLEEDRIEVQLADGQLTLDRPEVGSVTLLTGVQGLEIDYRNTVVSEAVWVSSWDPSRSPPAAVRLRIRRRASPVDTMLFLVGLR